MSLQVSITSLTAELSSFKSLLKAMHFKVVARIAKSKAMLSCKKMKMVNLYSRMTQMYLSPNKVTMICP